jgi:hypothetical protein
MEDYRYLGGTYCLHLQGRRIFEKVRGAAGIGTPIETIGARRDRKEIRGP